MFELIFSILVLTYGAILFIIIIGLRRRFGTVSTGETKVSIIVPVRNEEKNIRNLLDSLLKVNYPSGLLEIIIVDDESDDDTAKIAEEYLSKHKFIRLVGVEKNSSIPEGKARALDTGIKSATGEIIFITDADCLVPPEWVRSHLKYYDQKINMVCGFTSVSGSKQFEIAQNSDLIYLLGIASGTTNLGLPISCIGNNLSFRKSAYIAVGGYEKNPCSVNEDFYLLKAFNKFSPKSIIFPLEPGFLVLTKPQKNLAEFLTQKKRWGSTVKDVPGMGIFLMIIAFLTGIMCLFSGFYFSSVSLYLFFLKFALDYFYLRFLSGAFSINVRFSSFLLFEAVFIFYLISIPLLFILNRKVNWKGRVS